jgi:hypothetical protein
MRSLLCLLVFVTAALAQPSLKPIPADDAVRIREFYRLAAQIQDQIWPDWSKIPEPLLLVTRETEYLTHDDHPPADFRDVGNGFYARPRQFSTSLLATFPAFGPPSIIVIGQPANTPSKTSTPWLITVMHEHFHQLQNAQPGYFDAVNNLGLARGDNRGMWMLNYPFPYDTPEIARSFSKLRDLLLTTVSETNTCGFNELAARYKHERRKFFAQLAPDDAKYLEFQLWQEGIARYTQIKAAEGAAGYQPSPEYAALHDYESFASYGKSFRSEILDELKQADLPKMKRMVVYPFGAVEGLLLDRLNPQWKEQYFTHPLTMASFF